MPPRRQLRRLTLELTAHCESTNDQSGLLGSKVPTHMPKQCRRAPSRSLPREVLAPPKMATVVLTSGQSILTRSPWTGTAACQSRSVRRRLARASAAFGSPWITNAVSGLFVMLLSQAIISLASA